MQLCAFLLRNIAQNMNVLDSRQEKKHNSAKMKSLAQLEPEISSTVQGWPFFALNVIVELGKLDTSDDNDNISGCIDDRTLFKTPKCLIH